MAPPFGVFAGAVRRRGPPPVVLQFLRAPLTINNTVSLGLSIYLVIDGSGNYYDTAQYTPFTLLIGLISMCMGHNLLTVLWFHRARREVFSGHKCPSCDSWKSRRQITLESDEETRQARFQELTRRMSSFHVPAIDLGLAMGFLALFIWSTVVLNNMYKVRLAAAYASFGILIAFVFNVVIGLGGLRLWFLQRTVRGVNLQAVMSEEYLDATESLLPAIGPAEDKQEPDNSTSKGKQIEI